MWWKLSSFKYLLSHGPIKALVSGHRPRSCISEIHGSPLACQVNCWTRLEATVYAIFLNSHWHTFVPRKPMGLHLHDISDLSHSCLPNQEFRAEYSRETLHGCMPHFVDLLFWGGGAEIDSIVFIRFSKIYMIWTFTNPLSTISDGEHPSL